MEWTRLRWRKRSRAEPGLARRERRTRSKDRPREEGGSWGKHGFPHAYHRAMAERRALVTGIGGQDGSLLAELLLEQGYDVYGGVGRLGASYPSIAGVLDR